MSIEATEQQQIVNDCLDYTLFSWSRQGGLNPINARRADGVYIYDSDGKKYLDFSSQLMNVNIGHGHEKVKQAVMKQMDELCYVFPGMATEARATLGKKLAEITPGDLRKTFFTLGGAEAIENAIHYVEENPVREGKPAQRWRFVEPFRGAQSAAWTNYA